MTDDEMTAWLILKYGDLNKACKAESNGTFWSENTVIRASEDFTEEEMDLLEFHRFKKMNNTLNRKD